TQEFVPVYFPDNFVVTMPTGKLTLNRSDAIYEKTITPVERGALRRGWVMFQLPLAMTNLILESITAEKGDRGAVKIKIQDINGKNYLCAFEKGKPNPSLYLPGSVPFELSQNKPMP